MWNLVVGHFLNLAEGQKPFNTLIPYVKVGLCILLSFETTSLFFRVATTNDTK